MQRAEEGDKNDTNKNALDWFWIGFGLVLGSLLLIVILSSNGQVAAAPTQTASTNVTPSPSVRGIPGIPAIHPSLTAATPASRARFTTANVQAYLKSHPFVGGASLKGTTAKVTSIQFISSGQASTLMHNADTGLPTTALVCYVKIQGPFMITAPTAPGAKKFPPVDYGIEIFDGQTGNLLMWWIPSV